jgi:hypothetical protein
VTTEPLAFRHEVEAVMEGKFDVFCEALSFGDLDLGEMIGELKTLRVLGCCDSPPTTRRQRPRSAGGYRFRSSPRRPSPSRLCATESRRRHTIQRYWP